MKRATKRAQIALDLASMNAPSLVLFTRSVAKGLTNNPNLTAADVAKLPVTVADLLTSASALEATHTVRPTAPSKSSTKQEHDQATTLMEQLTNTAAYIEGLANTKAAGDLAEAQAIITSVGFPLKKTAVKVPKGFEVDSPAKGAAHVHVPAGAASVVRLVRYSMDGGKTYSPPIIVHGQDITITGLKSGLEGLFQRATNAPSGKKSKATIVAGTEEQAWSNPVPCVIS